MWAEEPGGRCLDGDMTTEQEEPRVVSASREIAAGPERIFELIADPAQQPGWDGNEVGKPPPGHLWRWELEPSGRARTQVTCTYDWTELTDPGRLPRARATTSERLRASLDLLAARAEGTGLAEETAR